MTHMQRIAVISILAFAIGCNASNPAWLGFTFTPKGGAPACTLQVEGVHPKSGAAQVGIKPGDLVVKLDGQPIPGVDQLRGKMKGVQVGQKMKIQLLRAGKALDFTVTLTARPDDIRSLMGSHVGSKVYPLGDNFYANKNLVNKAPKAVLLDFWATWCGPCRAAMPMLRTMFEQYRAKGFEVVSLSSEELPVLQDFQRQEKMTWPLYQDRNALQASQWGVSAVPTFILADGDWVVRKQWTGLPSQAEMDAAIQSILRGNP